MKDHCKPLSLRDAIRAITPEWSALLKSVGGNDDDAISALSGKRAGPLALDFEIVSKTLYAESERNRVRAFETPRAEIIDHFEALRRCSLVLKGYTAASPGSAVIISPNLPLDYDFARNSARCGEIQFYGITVSKPGENVGTGDQQPTRVADADLEVFCRKYLEGKSRVPSMDELWRVAEKEFPEKHVGRRRVEKLHRVLIPAHLRRPGPRK